jgi:hypothetical protein
MFQLLPWEHTKTGDTLKRIDPKVTVRRQLVALSSMTSLHCLHVTPNVCGLFPQLARRSYGDWALPSITDDRPQRCIACIHSSVCCHLFVAPLSSSVSATTALLPLPEWMRMYFVGVSSTELHEVDMEQVYSFDCIELVCQ